MSLPVILQLTSAGCGHCVAMRGSGQPVEPKKKADGTPLMPGPIPGDHHYSPTTLKQLLTGGTNSTRFRVYELYFHNLQPKSVADSKELSVFALVNGRVERTTYIADSNNTVTILKDGVKSTTLSKAYATVVTSLVPAEVMNYLYAFPSWLFTDGSIWDAAIQGKQHLYSRVSSHATVAVNGADGTPSYRVAPSLPIRPTPDLISIATTIAAGDLSSLRPSVDAVPTVTPAAAAPGSSMLLPTIGCRQLGYRMVEL